MFFINRIVDWILFNLGNYIADNLTCKIEFELMINSPYDGLILPLREALWRKRNENKIDVNLIFISGVALFLWKKISFEELESYIKAKAEDNITLRDPNGTNTTVAVERLFKSLKMENIIHFYVIQLLVETHPKFIFSFYDSGFKIMALNFLKESDFVLKHLGPNPEEIPFFKILYPSEEKQLEAKKRRKELLEKIDQKFGTSLSVEKNSNFIWE